MILDKRLLMYFDWMSLGIISLLSSISLFFVYSATYKPELPYSVFFYKQCFGMASGFVIYLACCVCDYRTLQRWGYFCYLAVIALLFFTLIKGSFAMGAHRWINVGLFKFQPSELAKLFFPAFFSYYLFTEETFVPSLATFVPIVSVAVISALLIIKQPDLGTGLLILGSAAILTWLAGIHKQIVLASCVLACVCAPILSRAL